MQTFKNYLEESSSEYLYNATYGVHKDSISKGGLKSKSDHKNWEDSKSGRIYLAKDPDVALSYAESSEEAPEHHLKHIIVYKIHKDSLDKNKVHDDSNVRNESSDTVEYHGDIPARHLEIHSEHKEK